MFFISKNYEKIKNSAFVIKVLNTVIPVLVGLLVVTSWQIAQTTIDNKLDLIILIISFILLVRFKINPAVPLSLLCFWVFYLKHYTKKC